MHEGHRERMRERLYFHGDSMSDHELLEILLFYAVPRKNTNPTAHELLDCFGSLADLLRAKPEEIERIAGAGRRSAELIYLAGLLAQRAQKEGKKLRLKSYEDVAAFVKERFAPRKTETLEIYCFGTGGALLCARTFGGGDGERVSVTSKQLSRLLAAAQPLSAVIAHNHPSGNCEPSAGDDEAVAEMYKICRINGVQLADCLIYADGEVYSYFHSRRFERLGIDRDTKEPYIILK